MIDHIRTIVRTVAATAYWPQASHLPLSESQARPTPLCAPSNGPTAPGSTTPASPRAGWGRA
jgi:hypothetical protein